MVQSTTPTPKDVQHENVIESQVQTIFGKILPEGSIVSQDAMEKLSTAFSKIIGEVSKVAAKTAIEALNKQNKTRGGQKNSSSIVGNRTRIRSSSAVVTSGRGRGRARQNEVSGKQKKKKKKNQIPPPPFPFGHFGCLQLKILLSS